MLRFLFINLQHLTTANYKIKDLNMNYNHKLMLSALLLFGTLNSNAATNNVSSPNGRLRLSVTDKDGRLYYSVSYDGKPMLCLSKLGITTNIGDFTKKLTYNSADSTTINKSYDMRTAKFSHISYTARQLNVVYSNAEGTPIRVTFNVSDNDIAFRYSLNPVGEHTHAIVYSEATTFSLPDKSTSFICPQSDPMTGWKRSKPSYEEEYTPDAPLTAKSKYGQGYTFPCLFRIGEDGWVLVSETGSHGNYPGCHLADYDTATRSYPIAFPMEGEAEGIGSTYGALPLPGSTPWRTITVGNTLKPIVETTIPFDVVEPLYTPSTNYKAGRYTWSWLIWQDNSINYDDQKQLIDLSSAMGYEYVLIDNYWDTQIGRDRVAQLSRYAQSKGVSLMLWYSSNGVANDAPQTPRNCMNTAVARKKEMAWMKSIGIKGIKVDFFGGDKQHTMQLYEDILSDANDYGLQVIFHGCTLPRGWERMYPNYVSSEAVLASENTYFDEHHAKNEGFELTMHPFCRNTVAAMDWGGTIMNRYMSRDNRSRHRRYTSDTFEMAAAIMNQASIQCIAIYPNNLSELPQHETDFLKRVPTTWDETRFIDGYPGKYAVIARQHGSRWYVVALNGTDKPMTLKLNLPMLAGQSITLYYDKADKNSLWPTSAVKTTKVAANGKTTITLLPMGGAILQTPQKTAANPILSGFHADPEVMYSNKTKRYYIYSTTDGMPGWGGYTYSAFSSTDLKTWTDEGVVLNAKNGQIAWADGNLWAPAIQEVKQSNGTYKYYLYFSANPRKGGGKQIGVAVADDPTGPFTDLGHPIITSAPKGCHGQEIDVDVFIDPVSQKPYLYWGNGYMAGAELEPNKTAIKPSTTTVLTPQGGTLNDYAYREAPYVFYRNGIYYFLWSVDDTGAANYHVAYGTASSPLGPITVAKQPVILKQNAADEIYGTAHNSIIQIPGTDEWRIVYHRINKAFINHEPGIHRQVCIDRMEFNTDGTIKPVTPSE